MKTNEDNYFTRMQRGELPPPPISTTLGGAVRAVNLDAGTLESDYLGVPAFLNPAGQLQGGVLSSMLDDVTALLVTATLQENQYCATLSLNVAFLRPALAGPLLGRAILTRRGREVCNVNGELWQAGKLIATATAVCMVVKKAMQRCAA